MDWHGTPAAGVYISHRALQRCHVVGMFLALTSVNLDSNCRSYRNAYAWVEGWNGIDDVIFGQPLTIMYVKIKEQLFPSILDN